MTRCRTPISMPMRPFQGERGCRVHHQKLYGQVTGMYGGAHGFVRTDQYSQARRPGYLGCRWPDLPNECGPDLIENFEPHRVPARYRCLIRLAGIVDPDGRAPLDYRLTFVGNKDEARESAHKLIAFEPERIIIAHGRWYERDGTAELRRAFRWLDV